MEIIKSKLTKIAWIAKYFRNIYRRWNPKLGRVFQFQLFFKTKTFICCFQQIPSNPCRMCQGQQIESDVPNLLGMTLVEWNGNCGAGRSGSSSGLQLLPGLWQTECHQFTADLAIGWEHWLKWGGWVVDDRVVIWRRAVAFQVGIHGEQDRVLQGEVYGVLFHLHCWLVLDSLVVTQDGFLAPADSSPPVGSKHGDYPPWLLMDGQNDFFKK